MSCTPNQQHFSPKEDCHWPWYLSQLQSPPGGAARLSPVPLANPCPPARVAALSPAPPPHLGPPRKVIWLSSVTPRTPSLPRREFGPNTPAWILPFCVEAGAGGAGAAEQAGGVTPRKGSTPTFPKSCFTVGCPPSPRHQHLPAKPHVPTPRAGQGPRPGRDSAWPRPRRAPAPPAGRGGRWGGPEGVAILTAFACHRHLQLQAGFTVVMDGLGWEGRGG